MRVAESQMAQKAITIGDFIARCPHLGITCKTCNTISTKYLNDVFFHPKMEFSVLQGMLSCPECGRSNGVEDKGSPIETAE